MHGIVKASKTTVMEKKKEVRGARIGLPNLKNLVLLLYPCFKQRHISFTRCPIVGTQVVFPNALHVQGMR